MTVPELIGKSVLRPDAHDKVTGGRGYPVNVQLPGMLHAKLLRSPYSHARIISVDTSEAEKLPGVKAVLTARDVPEIAITPVYFTPLGAHSPVEDFVIMSNRVRFAGQPVAAVAATSEAIAERALELIDVDYEELPTVFDPEQSMQEGAPQLHDSAPNNVAKNPVMEMGDVEAGFAEADHIFEGVYQTQRVHTCYMEPRVCVVDCDRTGQYTVHSSQQHIFGLREKLAAVLDVPEGKVTVVKPPYIGGGFGGKLDLGYIEPIAAMFSKRTGRPVRIEHTRYEDFITTARHPIKVYIKTGVKSDGTIIRVPMDLPSIVDKKRPKVHWGFLRQFRSLQEFIVNDILDYIIDYGTNIQIVITGHSLGAAQASLASLYFSLLYPSSCVYCYTFGSPRVGHTTFTKLFKKNIKEHKRFVNEDDPVTMIPFAIRFIHLPNLYYIDESNHIYRTKKGRWMTMIRDLLLSICGRENPVKDHDCQHYNRKLSQY